MNNTPTVATKDVFVSGFMSILTALLMFSSAATPASGSSENQDLSRALGESTQLQSTLESLADRLSWENQRVRRTRPSCFMLEQSVFDLIAINTAIRGEIRGAINQTEEQNSGSAETLVYQFDRSLLHKLSWKQSQFDREASRCTSSRIRGLVSVEQSQSERLQNNLRWLSR